MGTPALPQPRQLLGLSYSGLSSWILTQPHWTPHTPCAVQEFHQEPPEPPATEQQAAAAAGAPSTNGQLSLEEEFNIFADRHKGQYALRKLYHESDRLLAVLYTGGRGAGRDGGLGAGLPRRPAGLPGTCH